MRSLWSCSSCAVFLLVAVFGRAAGGSHAGRPWEDGVHRIAKAPVTPRPLRRDEGSCSTGNTACPASLGGGCCPSRYACATDSCFATTAGPTSACGKSGYYACPAADGTGCCPVGLVCGSGDTCFAPTGVSYTNTQCPSAYFLCPASLGYGCCRNGMGCALSSCYSTAPVTTTVTQTVTTTSGTRIITTTQTAVTIATPSAPFDPTATGDSNVAAKFIPTTVPKVPAASPSSTSDGGGLSSGAIGGIIASVAVLLVVVVVAAFLVIRRLKRVEDRYGSVMGSSSGRKSKSQSRAQMEHYGRRLDSPAYRDDVSVDPKAVGSNTNTTSVAGTPQPGTDAARRQSDSTGLSPSRHASPDSNAGHLDFVPAQNVPGGLQHAQQQEQQFALPMAMTPARTRASTDGSSARGGQYGGYAYHHWRHQSNASELSADGSDGGANATVHSPLVIPELDASATFVELPSSDRAAQAAGDHARSGSSSTASVRGRGGWLGHARRRDAAQQPHGATASGQPLTTLDEAAEMHGYYGRRDQQAGQTAAGLDVGSDVTGSGFRQT